MTSGARVPTAFMKRAPPVLAALSSFPALLRKPVPLTANRSGKRGMHASGDTIPIPRLHACINKESGHLVALQQPFPSLCPLQDSPPPLFAFCLLRFSEEQRGWCRPLSRRKLSAGSSVYRSGRPLSWWRFFFGFRTDTATRGGLPWRKETNGLVPRWRGSSSWSCGPCRFIAVVHLGERDWPPCMTRGLQSKLTVPLVFRCAPTRFSCLGGGVEPVC